MDRTLSVVGLPTHYPYAKLCQLFEQYGTAECVLKGGATSVVYATKEAAQQARKYLDNVTIDRWHSIQVRFLSEVLPSVVLQDQPLYAVPQTSSPVPAQITPPSLSLGQTATPVVAPSIQQIVQLVQAFQNVSQQEKKVMQIPKQINVGNLAHKIRVELFAKKQKSSLYEPLEVLLSKSSLGERKTVSQFNAFSKFFSVKVTDERTKEEHFVALLKFGGKFKNTVFSKVMEKSLANAEYEKHKKCSAVLIFDGANALTVTIENCVAKTQFDLNITNKLEGISAEYPQPATNPTLKKKAQIGKTTPKKQALFHSLLSATLENDKKRPRDSKAGLKSSTAKKQKK